MSTLAPTRSPARPQARAQTRAQPRPKTRFGTRFQSGSHTSGKRSSVAVEVPIAVAARSAEPRSWGAVLLPILAMLRRVAGAAWVYLRQGQALPLLGKRQRRLRVSETLSLGDKRFVSIVEVDGQSFLIGSGGGSIALLASLAPEQAPEQAPFGRVLRDSLAREEAE